MTRTCPWTRSSRFISVRPGLKIGLIGSRSGAFGSRAFGSRDVRLLGLVLWVQVLGFRV